MFLGILSGREEGEGASPHALRPQIAFNKEDLFNDGSLKESTTQKDYRRAFKHYVAWSTSKKLEYPQFITADRVTMYLLEKERAGAVRTVLQSVCLFFYIKKLYLYTIKINLRYRRTPTADFRGPEPCHEGISILPAASGS